MVSKTNSFIPLARVCTRTFPSIPPRPSLARSPKCIAPTSRAIHSRPTITSRPHISRPQLQWPSSSHRALSARAATAKLFRTNPFSATLATIIILFGMGTLVYTNYIYKYYIVEQFSAYPEPVAAKLRRAIYYHNIDVQPKLAVKYYRQALELAAQCGMDAFSDEVIGVKIQLAFLMEKIGELRRAAEVLEVVLKDCVAWVEDEGRGGKEERRAQRTRVLGKMVGVSVKLGELYANEHIGEQEAAEERLVWAVTTVLKEQERREREGVREGEGEWMNSEEIGGALESLGDHYEKRNLHFLAAPLYLQAVSMIPQTNCHAITLMNNLSISLALQNPPLTGGMPSPSSASQIDAARTWANRALSVDRALQNSESRTEECDQACAVTQINLGEFAEMEGSLQEARRMYEEGVEFSRKVGFQEGVIKGREALRRLDKLN